MEGRDRSFADVCCAIGWSCSLCVLFECQFEVLGFGCFPSKGICAKIGLGKAVKSLQCADNGNAPAPLDLLQSCLSFGLFPSGVEIDFVLEVRNQVARSAYKLEICLDLCLVASYSAGIHRFAKPPIGLQDLEQVFRNHLGTANTECTFTRHRLSCSSTLQCVRT